MSDMAAFADLLDLKVAVVGVLRRDDFSDWFPQIVQLAESWMNQNLRTREQITAATLTVTSGSATLPTDFVEMIGVFDAAGNEYPAQPVQNAKTSGQTNYWTVNGTTFFTTGADGSRSIQYYAAVPTLILASAPYQQTNWALSRFPALYLYAVATEAARWVRDAEMAMALEQSRDRELSAAKAADFSARYARARVRVAGCTP